MDSFYQMFVLKAFFVKTRQFVEESVDQLCLHNPTVLFRQGYRPAPFQQQSEGRQLSEGPFSTVPCFHWKAFQEQGRGHPCNGKLRAESLRLAGGPMWAGHVYSPPRTVLAVRQNTENASWAEAGWGERMVRE